MSSSKDLRGLIFVFACLVCLYLMVPLASALEFGKDEGFELMKGFLCSKGFSLYTQIWNDQPPVFTKLLSLSFKIFGPSALTARVIAAGFGLLLCGTFYTLVCERSGTWAGLTATFMLLASPVVFLVTASVMLEVPAIATALTSALLLTRWCRNRGKPGWLIASGVLMGLALQIKLTAVLVAPAILLDMLVQPAGEQRFRLALQRVLLWGGAVLIIFSAIGLTWGVGSFESALKSHLSSIPPDGSLGPQSFRFDPALLVQDWGGVLAAAAALVWFPLKKRRTEVRFPLSLLVVAVTVHALHRPWWNYYYLHLAVPLAWLSGLSITQVVRSGLALISTGRFQMSSASTQTGLVLCVPAAVVLAWAEARMDGTIRNLRGLELTKASPVIAKMRQYAPRTHWVYADEVIYPFQANLAVPPELAVVMFKRLWSGQISTPKIVEICQRYQPEQILICSEPIDPAWRDLLDSRYRVALKDRGRTLMVSKALLTQ